MEKRKAGRPTRDPDGDASKIVPIRMTERERETFHAAAQRAGKTLSQWVRDQLRVAAKRQSKRD